MDDLVAFVRQQLDARERLARAALAVLPGQWVPMYRDVHAVRLHDDHHEQQHIAQAETGGLAAFIADNDPLAVLAEVEAKRRILDWCVRLDPGWAMGGLLAGESRKIQRLLAQPYAGRPGWREEWAV